jgi:hypothetical protein
MEGYSVTEAASILGVPTERVWELLARGILSGASDGETGMRVYLQPRPAPQLVDEPRRSNGHGNARDGDAEASPFRELLTEFRGLTERYGQALLALGEARGEVASLRSRVDVLEARMDLRLPFSSPMTPSSPMTSEPTRRASDRRAPVQAEAAEGGMTSEPDAAVDIEPEPERSARRKRSRAHFSDEFADALARAEDPSPAVLRDAREAEKAVVDAQRGPDETPAAELEAADWALPRELPAAEAMVVAEPEPEPLPEPEPDPAPEPSLSDALASVPEPEPPTEPEPPPALVLVPDLPSQQEPEPQAEPVPVPELVPTPEAAAEQDLVADVPEPQPLAESEPAEEPDLVAGAVEAPVAEAEPAEEPDLVVETPDSEPRAEAEPAEPDLAAGAVEATLGEAEPAADIAPESTIGAEPEQELSVSPAVEAEPAVDAVAAEGGEPSAEASWDQETYSARIEEPDWWTPEEGLWPEPEASSDSALPEPAAEEPEPIATERERWAGPHLAPGWPADEEPDLIATERERWAGPDFAPGRPADESDEPAAPDELEAPAEAVTEGDAIEAQEPTMAVTVEGAEQVATPQPYLGEETMMWFGRRPDDSGSTESTPEDAAGDAAGEMEVASTGLRSRLHPEHPNELPGGDELDDALAGLDSLVGQRGTSVPHPGSLPNAAQPEPPPMRPRVGDQPVHRPPQLNVPSGPATRAYRRLRRIFPG